MKRVLSILSLIMTLCVLLSCTVTGASAAEEPQPPFYTLYPYHMVVAGMPKTIKAQFDYDRNFIEIASDYPGYENKGFVFPLATEEYGGMYDVSYTVNDTVITYTYTLKDGYTLDDYLDATGVSSAYREAGAKHGFPVFDVVMTYEDASFWGYMAKVVDHKILQVIDTEGKELHENGRQDGDVVVWLSDWRNLPDPNAPATPDEAQKEYKYREKLLSQYHLNEYTLEEYDEIYEHTDENGEVDWAIVKAATEKQTSSLYTSPRYFEFGNRVLDIEDQYEPFAFGMGVYSVKHDRFFDVSAAELYELDALERVWTDIGVGRLIGDMDGDNKLTSVDAALIRRCAAGMQDYPESDKNIPSDMVENPLTYFSDFDQDGERTIMDVTAIQRYLANLPYRSADWTPYPHKVQPTEPVPTEPVPTEPIPTEPIPTEPIPTEADDPIPRITGFRSIGKGVEISLSEVKGAEKYRVYYWSKANNTWKSMGETSGSTFIDTDVNVGSTYRYTVRCINTDLSAFTSDFDHDGWTYTYDPQLETPQITDMEAVSNGVRIKWGAVDGADLYRVYYRKINSSEWQKLDDVRETSYTHNEAEYDSILYYTVRCLSCKAKGFASDFQSSPQFKYGKAPVIIMLSPRADSMEIQVEHNNTGGRMRLYRKESTGWKKIGDSGVMKDGYYTFLDDNVEVGKSYTYTARSISADGKFFTSWYNTTGKSKKYSVENYVPEFEFIIYAGDNMMLVQAKENKFGLERYQLDIYDPDTDTGGWVIIDSEPHYIRADEIAVNKALTLYLTGIDQNDNRLSADDEYGYRAVMELPPHDLTVRKLRDRKYRFTWGNYSSGCNLNLISNDGEYIIDSEYIGAYGWPYYDVDLSDYPEDIHWTCVVWNCTKDGVCCSMPISIEFNEADYQ